MMRVLRWCSRLLFGARCARCRRRMSRRSRLATCSRCIESLLIAMPVFALFASVMRDRHRDRS